VTVRLSICVLTYNRRELLVQLLNSISSSGILKDDSVELIVMNNGSNDGTANYLEEFAQNNRLRVVNKDSNSRGSVAYEELFSFALGEWIIAPGDDDIFNSDVLAQLSEIIVTTSNEVSLIPFAANTIDEFGKVTPVKFVPTKETNSAKLMGKLMQESIFWFPSTCFRRKIVSTNVIPKTITVFDWWIWIQGVMLGTVSPRNEILLEYRMHSGQEQRSFTDSFWSIDYAETFNTILKDEKFRNWLELANDLEIGNMLETISEKNNQLLMGEQKLILFKLGILISNAKPHLKTNVLLFLINLGIDARLASVHIGTKIDSEVLVLALKMLTKKDKDTWNEMSYNELESIFQDFLTTKRKSEIEQQVTPFEWRMVRFYRKIRYLKISRMILKR